MLFVDFVANNTNYKLRINTRALIMLEKDLGYNPIKLFGVDVKKPVTPSLEDMLKVFKASLQPYHNSTEEDAYAIFDAWLDDGHITTDFIPIIVEVYRASGLINKKSKN